jgi:hypothetical protein
MKSSAGGCARRDNEAPGSLLAGLVSAPRKAIIEQPKLITFGAAMRPTTTETALARQGAAFYRLR